MHMSKNVSHVDCAQLYVSEFKVVVMIKLS